MKNVTGIILCGGKSSRMGGRPKGLIDFQGKTFTEQIGDMMSTVCKDIVLSANSPQYHFFKYPVVSDKYPNQGPLAGIRAGLEFSQSDSNIFVPCDMPLVDPALLQKMIDASDCYEAVVPNLDGKITSMPLLLKKSVLEEVEIRILEGNRKVMDLVKALKYTTVRWEAAEQNPVLSKNVNTEKDLLELLKITV